MPVTVRLRHPKGVTTLSLEPAEQTVDQLRVLIFSSSEIPPTEQELKFGYPPKSISADGSALLSSIPITKGEQIIVTHQPSQSSSHTKGTTSATALPIKQQAAAISQPSPPSSTPAPAPQASSSSTDGDAVQLPGDAGQLVLRVVPDDNSCLFSAISVVFEREITGGERLRRVVADAIEKDPESYPDVVLGQPRSSYISKVLKPATWGGAIELSIFSKHYKTEISSFDVATGRCDRFGQGEYDHRCILVYSGIHYDAVTQAPFPSAPGEFHTTLFPVGDEMVFDAAGQLVQKLKSRHYYTDTATFDLRCGVCKIGLKGEKGAREHAIKTGHVEFGEY